MKFNKLLQLASIAVVTLSSFTLEARADSAFHTSGQIYACVNPRATRALANKSDPRQSDPGWVNYVISDGRCFSVTPEEKWEQISQENGMLLLRRDPPRVGMPPLFFQPDQVLTGPPAPIAATEASPSDGSPLPSGSDDTSRSEASPQTDASNILPKDWQKPRPADSGVEGNKALSSTSSVVANSVPAPDAKPPATSPQQSESSGGSSHMWWLLVLVLIILGARSWYKFVSKRQAEERRVQRLNTARMLINQEIDNQATALQIKRLQLATPDHYGTVNLGRWFKEVGYFCDTRLQTILAGAGLEDQWVLIAGEATAKIDEVASHTPPGATLDPAFVSDPRTFDTRMDPIDYERHCALLLRQAGWDARVTQASGDQGADVIATRNGKKIVVQCKLYSQPVGNKAVQEVYTAKQHQRADAALVVSNAGYTPQARQLANTTGVYLLHHQELAGF